MMISGENETGRFVTFDLKSCFNANDRWEILRIHLLSKLNLGHKVRVMFPSIPPSGWSACCRNTEVCGFLCYSSSTL